MIFFAQFRNYNGLIHGVMERNDGNVNPFSFERSLGSIRKALEKLGLRNASSEDIFFAQQVHENRVVFLGPGERGGIKTGVDGLISQTPGQILVVRTADCLPILIFSPEENKVGAVHAGREGLMKGVVEEAVKNFGKPESLIVGIGPHIRKCCYFLRGRKRDFLPTAWKSYIEVRNNKTYLDLTKIAKDKLLKLGVEEKNIEDCEICTFCQGERFYSARKKEQEKIEEEKFLCFGSFIGLC